MSNNSDESVIIVSGLPRSGTSMMMQMIDKGGVPALIDEIRVADDDNPKGYYEFEPVKKTKEDASWVNDAPGKVVKMVHLLLLDLPDGFNYRVVFMRRELDEVIKSQNIMLERSQKGGGDISEDMLKKIFLQQIEKVYNFVESKPNFEMLEMSYNNLLKEPAPAIASINEFLGGQLNTDAMHAVVDPSLYRNRVSAEK